jgi:hypothetical protein
MDIKVERLPRPSIEQFADEHGLVLEICERRPDLVIGGQRVERWYAHFEKVDVIDGCCLVGISGNGDTPEQAVADYIGRIRGQEIAINHFSLDRKNVFVPWLSDELPKTLPGENQQGA